MKNKTRRLNDLVSYRVGKKFCNIIVNGKRYNFTLDDVRGQMPEVSNDAKDLLFICYKDLDICYYESNPVVVKELESLVKWQKVTPKKIDLFVKSEGLLQASQSV